VPNRKWRGAEQKSEELNNQGQMNLTVVTDAETHSRIAFQLIAYRHLGGIEPSDLILRMKSTMTNNDIIITPEYREKVKRELAESMCFTYVQKSWSMVNKNINRKFIIRPTRIDSCQICFQLSKKIITLPNVKTRSKQVAQQQLACHSSIAYELAIAPEEDGLDLQTLLSRMRATSALNRQEVRQEISKSKCFSYRGGKWYLNANVKGGLCQKCLKIRHSKAKFQAKFLDNVQAREDQDPLS